MPERFTDVLAVMMAALAIGYFFYEVDQYRRNLRELVDVLDDKDTELSASLVRMVESGELKPYAGGVLA